MEISVSLLNDWCQTKMRCLILKTKFIKSLFLMLSNHVPNIQESRFWVSLSVVRSYVPNKFNRTVSSVVFRNFRHLLCFAVEIRVISIDLEVVRPIEELIIKWSHLPAANKQSYVPPQVLRNNVRSFFSRRGCFPVINIRREDSRSERINNKRSRCPRQRSPQGVKDHLSIRVTSSSTLSKTHICQFW